MKIKVVLLLVALLSLPAAGQQNSLVIQQTFSASGSSNWYPIAGYTSHTLTWSQVGSTSVVGCAVQVDSSAVGGSDSGSSGGIITSQSATSNGTTSVTTVSASYARITVTGCSAGTIKVTYSAVNAALSKGGGGGGGGSLPALTNNQIVGGVGTTATALNGFTFGSGTLATLNIGNATFAGGSQINLGAPSGQANQIDLVDQNTGNIFRFNQSGAFYTASNIWDPVISFGWNSAVGGGSINPAFPALWQQMEGNYCLTSSADCTVEWHNILKPTNTNTADIRWMTCQWAAATGIQHFCNFSLDLGVQYTYGVNGDGTPVTAVTAAWTSANGGTFTYTKPTGNWPWDYLPSSASYVSITGCTPTAYNTASGSLPIVAGGVGVTTFTLTGVGANPGSSATGCSVQGGQSAAYATVSGTGISTGGVNPITSGAGMVENNAGNANAGHTFYPETGQFGGANNLIIFHAGGASGITAGTTTCSTAGTFEFPGAGFDYFYCNGTNWVSAGNQFIAGTLGLKHSSSGLPLATSTLFDGSISGGLDIATNVTSVTNACGKIDTSNGGGSTLYDIGYCWGGNTGISTMYIGGWSTNSIATIIVDGGNAIYTGNGSATGTLNVGAYQASGTAGVTAGSFSAITAIQSKAGIITTLTGTSDARLKTDFAPFTRGLGDIANLETVCYGWNAEGQKITGFPSTLRQCGYTAQALQASIPEAVGAPETHDGVDYLTVSDRPVIAALVNAVKEQQAEILELKAEIAALKH